MTDDPRLLPTDERPVQSSSRRTIMDGEVVTLATRFEEKPGVFGPIQEAAGPFEVSASRNRIYVHSASLASDESVELLITALRQAQEVARRLAREDRGNYNWRRL